MMNTLIAARDLIKDENSWCQRVAALDSSGRPATILGMEACRWCATGALTRATEGRHTDIAQLCLLEAGQRLGHEFRSVPLMNDALTHAELIEVFDKAIETERNV